MPGLFAAEGGAGREHLFEDVLVADGGAQHLDAGAAERGFEAHVGHCCSDYRRVVQQPARVQVAAREQQDSVAVDDSSLLVGEEDAVGVAVEGDADGSPVRDHLGGDDFGVQRAAAEIDVASVGAGVGDGDGAAEVGEELGRDRAGGSVGAIDDDVMVIERETGNGGEQEANVLGAVGFVDGRGDSGNPRLRIETWGTQLAEDFGFDGEFGGIGKLEAVGAEELDAVILPGIVGGGDDDAGGEAVNMG